MYEERNGFPIRKFILQALLVILFVFIMIWLFPTKDYMEETFVTEDELINRLQSIYGRNFADNIETMRDAAKDYFTTERLPKKVGDSVTLTLQEMLDKKMVLEFVDSNNQKCNVKESYVNLTKMDTEYQLKVQLTCSDYSDYIIDYIGCYDYCDSCNTTPTTPTRPTTPTKPTTPTEPETPVVEIKYTYEYRLTTQNEYSAWSNWSEWSTKKVTANNLTQVEQETRKEIAGYNEEQVITGYNKEQVITGYNKEQVITGYNNYQTQECHNVINYGTKTEYRTYDETVVTDTKDATYNAGGYSEWVSAGTIVTVDEIKYTNDTTRYTQQNVTRYRDCTDSCKYVTKRVYTVETRTYTQPSYSCQAGYTLEGTVCKKYETVTKQEAYEVPITSEEQVCNMIDHSDPVYGEKETPVYGEKETPIYGTKKTPIYKEVTYYRYRTRTQTSVANTVYKWSESKEDKTLLSQGYVLTGNKKEVK